MENRNFLCFYGVIFYCLFFYPIPKICAQDKIVLRGKVLKSVSNTPIEDVLIRVISDQTIFTYTNKSGFFSLELRSKTTFKIEVSVKDFISQVFKILPSNKESFYLGTILMFQKQDALIYSNILKLSEDELLDNDIGGANAITGLLQSSKDVFIRTAAFNFGQARFKIRGYDSREGTILINGVKMNKIQTGRPQWSNWGGLNDVLRNLTFSNGIAPTIVSFGSVLGTTNFKTRASEYRPGSGVSLAASNGSYKGRIMVSHFTGIVKNDWAFAFSMSSRFAKEGAVDGTFYKAYSVFVSAEKMINKQHSVNLTAIYAFNRRGKSSANTQEVFDLKGGRYNSYWGNQEGEKRNSRVKEVKEPLLLFNHYWKMNKNASLNSSLSYQFGHISSSRLGYANVNSPDPSYYKYLPSSALRYDDFSETYKLIEAFKEDGQLNWKDLYATNNLTNTSSYYLYEDRNEDRQLTFNTVFNTTISSKLNFNIGLSYRNLESLNFALVLDDLGGGGFFDVDSFEEGDTAQSDLNNRDRVVTVGDPFSYNYRINFAEVELFFQSTYRLRKWEWVGSFRYNQTSYQRTGFYKNGKYPNSSFGAGTKESFKNGSVKLNTLYKFSGRHLLYGNLAFIARVPVLKNMYSNIRVSSEVISKIRSESIKTIDLTYQYRAPRIKSKITGYYTIFSNGTENSFVYAEGLGGDSSDFIAQSVTDIEKKHKGIELGVDIELTAEFSMSIVAAIGQYTYNNNPNLFIESDLFNDGDSDFGTVYLKNYKIGGTPQRAYSLGINYKNPAYWWVALNGNFLTHHYLSVSPLLRTNNFYLDADGIPFVNTTTGNEITQEQVSSLLKQERFEDLVLVNLVGGKSWKLRDNYLGLFFSLNNLLGKTFKTGGFEQSRKANYIELLEDKSLTKPLFGPKYWLKNGTSYYVILSYRF
ncbi:TonB-dependent receptor [Flavicella sp.]|uniref:TonB-dependent receptor n=1 Tax=Flavicella sp. TaxID=2957742 RepID=UPI0030167681